MISPYYVLCYIPQALDILGKKLKIFRFTSYWRGGGPFDLCGFGNFRENIENFGFFYILKVLEIIENITKLPVIICKMKGRL